VSFTRNGQPEETNVTNPGDTGGGGTGGQQGTPGTGGSSTGPPSGGSGAGTAPPPAGDEWADRDAWRALATELGQTPEQIRTALGHARTWEQRAKDNREAATRSTTLEQQVKDMREQLAEREAADLLAAERTAVSALRAELATLGMDRTDITDALEFVDTSRLLDKGAPDEKAIETIAAKLARVAGRPQPDRDQGANGQSGPPSMNDWVRQQVAARRR
jgi:hypothetical protein